MINFITGATGFLGQNLIKKLLEEDEKIFILVRGDSKDDVEKKIKNKFPESFKKIKIFVGDILKNDLGINKEEIANLKNEKIIIWHLAANLSFATKDKDIVWKTNFNGTKNIVKFANKIKSEKIVYVSTAYVSGNFKGQILEDKIITGQKFENNYEASKYAAEKYLRENFKNTFLIVRPSIILGEVYTGKAAGCTFGYYRFSYMFFLFKLWIIKKITGKNGFWKITLKLFGTKYNKEENKITLPWFIMLYVKGGKVDLIPVDYVVKAMIEINKKQKQKKEIVHLTNKNSFDPEFLMKLILDDLGYEGVKHKKISKWLFLSIMKVFYLLTYPIKNYTKSIYWYIPYLIRNYDFNQENIKKYNINFPQELDEKYMRTVNIYAREKIYDTINNPKL